MPKAHCLPGATWKPAIYAIWKGFAVEGCGTSRFGSTAKRNKKAAFHGRLLDTNYGLLVSPGCFPVTRVHPCLLPVLAVFGLSLRASLPLYYRPGRESSKIALTFLEKTEGLCGFFEFYESVTVPQ